MIPVLRAAGPDVTLLPSPAGFHIIWALRTAALTLGHDIVITAGSNGQHSGPDDPHYLGNAFDLRTHDVEDKQLMLDTITNNLGTAKFYAFIEDPDTDNEHIHVQLRHGIIYP